MFPSISTLASLIKSVPYFNTQMKFAPLSNNLKKGHIAHGITAWSHLKVLCHDFKQ